MITYIKYDKSDDVIDNERRFHVLRLSRRLTSYTEWTIKTVSISSWSNIIN